MSYLLKKKNTQKKSRMLSAALLIGALRVNICFLTFTMLWANSADDKLMKFFLFFLENRI